MQEFDERQKTTEHDRIPTETTPRVASPHEVSSPGFEKLRRPDDLLSQTTLGTFREPTEQVTVKPLENPVQHALHSRGPRGVSDAVVKTALSSETWSGVGNVGVSLQFPLVATMHFAAAIWAVRNQLVTLPHPDGAEERNPVSPSFTNLLDYSLHSPGVYRIAQGASWIVGIGSTIATANLTGSAVYTLFAVGSFAAAHILNADFRELRPNGGLGAKLDYLWEQLPSRARSFFSDPGPFWCAGSLITSLSGVGVSGLTSLTSLIPAAGALGVIAYQLTVATNSRTFDGASSRSLILSGTVSMALGISNLTTGNSIVGAALFSWAASTFLLANAQDKKMNFGKSYM